MKNIFTIWKKELQDTLRDRRTLMSMVVLPMVLMPLIMIGLFKIMEVQIKSLEAESAKVALYGTETEVMKSFLEKQDKIEIIETDKEVEMAVKDKDVQVGVVVPDGYENQLEQNKPVELQIYYNSIDDKSATAVSKVNVAINEYNSQLLAQRFTVKKIDPNILTGLVLSPQDVATEQEKGGFGLGFLLPLFLVMWATSGGQYTAIDVSAGEKERKTLESLLLTPVKRIELVSGKFMAIATVSLVSVVVSLVSMFGVFKVFGSSFLSGNYDMSAETSLFSGLEFTFEPKAFFLLLLISFLIVVMFSAVLLSIAIFARSFKEAQSYISPSYLIVILPTVIINSIPGFSPPDWFYAIPVINSVSIFKEILIGTYNTTHIMLTVVSLVVASAISIWVATTIYQKENVLFKD